MKAKNYTFPCQYYVLEVPSGCRKPRPMLHTDEITVRVPVVTSAEAPVACVYSPDAPITAENMQSLMDTPECLFRYFNGSFYRRWTLCQHWGPQEVTEADCLEHFLGNVIAVPKESSDVLAKFAADEAGLFFILDGDKPQVWAKVEEPCWAVQTEAKGKNSPKVTLEFTSLGKYSFPKFGATETDLAKRFVKILADRNHFSCEAELVKDHLVVLMPEVFRGNVMEQNIFKGDTGVYIKPPYISDAAAMSIIKFMNAAYFDTDQDVEVYAPEFELFTRMLISEKMLMVSPQYVDLDEVKEEFTEILAKKCSAVIASFWLLVHEMYPAKSTL